MQQTLELGLLGVSRVRQIVLPPVEAAVKSLVGIFAGAQTLTDRDWGVCTLVLLSLGYTHPEVARIINGMHVERTGMSYGQPSRRDAIRNIFEYSIINRQVSENTK
jgi:hypothetical protein